MGNIFLSFCNFGDAIVLLIPKEDNPVSNKTELVDVKRSLDLLRIEKDKRIMFQARVAFTEHNEKPTNFFMRKIKENFFESNVIELVKEGGSVIQG